MTAYRTRVQYTPMAASPQTSECIDPPVAELLALFHDELSNLSFPGVDAKTLEAAATAVREASQEVERLRARLNDAEVTPRGLFPLKFFFHSGIDREYGGDISSLTVKRKIQNFIAGENAKKPLSDSELMRRIAAGSRPVSRLHSGATAKSTEAAPTRV